MNMTNMTKNTYKSRILSAFALLAALLLSACQSSTLGIDTRSGQEENPGRTLTANPKGELFGQGSVRVTLIIPKSAPGNAARVANEIRNGALLAMKDFGQNTLQLVIKDSGGQAAPAQQAASEAVQEGSSIVIGPLFAGNVSAVSGITQPANITVLGFSTDSSVARRGTYLLSYAPEDDAERILNYAVSQGSRSVVAFLPNNRVGTLNEAVLRKTFGSVGANVRVFKYARTIESIREAVANSTSAWQGADSVYIPDGDQIPTTILASLSQNGLSLRGKQIYGSGNWESVKLNDPKLNGALYSGRDTTNFQAFANRYETNYNSKPSVLAALGYDSVTLVSELVRQNGPERAFANRNLENRRGFAGINGIFRLRSDGTTERGRAVYKVQNGVGQLVSPAPKSFSRSGT